MTHIAFVGHAVWDHIFTVPKLLAEPGKWVANSFHCRPGGMSANAALAAQKLRGVVSPAVRLAAPMGDDKIGRALADDLQAAGVELVAPCVIAGARTSTSVVLVDAQGERQGHNVRGNAQEQAPLPDETWLAGVLALQVDPRWPPGAQRALELARHAGIPSLLDADVAPTAHLRALAPLADWVVFSTDGLRAWADDHSASLPSLFAAACVALPTAHVAVTRGAGGLIWRPTGQAAVTWPAHSVRAVNTNGAGDALHGALLLALAEGLSPEAALRVGMAAAALTCTAQDFGRSQVWAMAGLA
jgi:sulfofructose kinase